jgi:Tfp pilus assembly protein PilF
LGRRRENFSASCVEVQGKESKWADLVVRHTGYVDKALRSRKLDRDTKLLTRDLEERPDEPSVLFNLATLALERGDGPEAEALWRAVLRDCPGDREALARLARLAERR